MNYDRVSAALVVMAGVGVVRRPGLILTRMRDDSEWRAADLDFEHNPDAVRVYLETLVAVGVVYRIEKAVAVDQSGVRTARFYRLTVFGEMLADALKLYGKD